MPEGGQKVSGLPAGVRVAAAAAAPAPAWPSSWLACADVWHAQGLRSILGSPGRMAAPWCLSGLSGCRSLAACTELSLLMTACWAEEHAGPGWVVAHQTLLFQTQAFSP